MKKLFYNQRFLLWSISIIGWMAVLTDLSAVGAGGIFLVFGATYAYYGNIFYSIIIYAVADVAWLYNAYENGDMFGAFTVTLGIILGSLVTLKMHRGKFRKDVRNETT